ncbi:MAG: sulfate adenylyltransferase subunit CysN [Bacteroidales bacterium]|nr:sulfate adenylyltransferase subunit CysN [Bacteroidales bacterium]
MNELVKEYLDRELLRFTTAGSVDDGKSTLIGRLLYDSKAIFADQLEAIEMASKRRGEEQINLALLTDGLRAEREQGITIDVAYRYFSTPKRKFIIADTPGHIQYTRNMVTGASTANVAIILIDARNGVVEQTIRHSYIASLLRIPHIIVCVNKMDLVNYSEEVFEKIRADYENVSTKISVKDIRFIPISALKGDNVVNRSENTPWYDGPSLMHLLETIHIASDLNFDDPRFPVQYVIRPNNDEFHDYRGYAGRVASGVFKVGDPVTVLPSGFTSRIRSIDLFGEILPEAFAPQSVTIQIEDDIDISRGDMLVRSDNLPTVGQDIDLMICWLNDKPMQVGNKYYLRHTTTGMRCIVKEIVFKVDINTLEELPGGSSLQMNEIARIRIRTSQPLVYDPYEKNRTTGSLILIDEGTNETVGAGMIK